MKKRNLPYPLKIASHTLRLPEYIKYFIGKHEQTDSVIDKLNSTVSDLTKRIETLEKSFEVSSRVGDRIADLQHQIATISVPSSKESTKQIINDTVSDNHKYDEFYKRFEDKFRGSEETITERLKEHLPLFNGLSTNLKKKPIIDIGCGRGELLGLLTDHGLHPVGVDMNEAMVARAKKSGYEAYATDAYSYLSGLKSSSVASITGFHIVEHIPFESLMEIFHESYRVMSREGFALFETPNPESLLVGAHTFYLDPPHQRPIPPQLRAFMLEYVGFSVEILYLHQIKKVDATKHSKSITSLFDTVYGYADYAVVARKL